MVLAQGGVLLASAAAGLAVGRAGWPLPWIIGPLLATATAAIAGLHVFAPQAGHRVGQWLIGTAIGLGLTAAVAGKVLEWLPLMVVTALVSVAICALCSRPFARLAGLDAKTAHFALMPGGLARDGQYRSGDRRRAGADRPQPDGAADSDRQSAVVPADGGPRPSQQGRDAGRGAGRGRSARAGRGARGRGGVPGDGAGDDAGQARSLDHASLVASFARGVAKDEAAVRAAITLPWSNGQTEGQITKLKLVKRATYGRGKLDLLQARLIGADP